jgi:hypothetical protein
MRSLMIRLYRLREDYIVIRYSREASSLPSEKICNLQVTEDLAHLANSRRVPAVRFWDETSRDLAASRSRGIARRSCSPDSLADFLAKPSASCYRFPDHLS